MKYSIRKAENADLERILQIYADARAFMAENGNPDQWGTTHPPVAMLEEDIQIGHLFVAENNTGIHGVFAFLLGEDPTYVHISDGAWRSDTPYGTIHRIASDGSGGVLPAALNHCKKVIGHIRIDTHMDNVPMKKKLEQFGFQYCGIIYVADGTSRLAYDWLL